ncbi:Proteasome lid subunit RPN8/RPN11, contains Jab1/MPN metalloenzyme (JAMM) motif [Fodinibius roseus]|uniref:Proteasome lid subunit RPN8/RPN11, contains Jab1/MPN metalloenzyme (JAMM) motif n=1 Tax=Fodinibius roseus TaxID=1194090 RepID=A0A1M5I5K2_9BACT|nr:M67 family metallopeptidase [Fodinibius roseus]SHG23555.1 Proteasome lid subunit RPN8/RPN11, contains Jab1/MPN metalloenzyme (JAMM) motif [Fodinibius roseus]
MKLNISNHALQKMRSHAEADYPNECCGFFYGLEGEVRQVQIARQVDNAKDGDQRRRFQIDPRDYRKAEQYAIDHDLDLLGVYHSHPDHPAEPSEHDRKVAMPWFSYIIISVRDGAAADVRSWRLNDHREFEEESTEVKEFIHNTET